MSKFNIGDKVTWVGFESYGEGRVTSLSERSPSVRFENFQHYDDTEYDDFHTPPEKDLRLVEEGSADSINPGHYSGDLVMRVIEERGLDFALGNAVKYLCRAGSKPGASRKQDLLKAQWYLNRAIEKEEGSSTE